MSHEQLVNTNHNSNHSATASLADEQQLLERLGELYGTFSLFTGEHDRQLCTDLNELRRLRALADERFLQEDGRTEHDKGPPRLWDVRTMAKQLGLADEVVRKRARSWAFTLCVAHQRCRGGTRGCDLRFIAKEAAAWVSARRGRSK
jgi:hypothetical protein